MIFDKQKKYDTFFMKTALLAAENSYAIRNKVGAILAINNRIVASGWNGQPHGFDNVCEKSEILEDGTQQLITLPTVIHAEANLISFCAKNGIKTEDSTLYITLSPCINCALLIIQAGIKCVKYKEIYRNTDGLELLKQSGIVVEQIKL